MATVHLYKQLITLDKALIEVVLRGRLVQMFFAQNSISKYESGVIV